MLRDTARAVSRMYVPPRPERLQMRRRENGDNEQQNQELLFSSSDDAEK